ncbi:hypothetical protein [Lysobacter olei]
MTNSDDIKLTEDDTKRIRRLGPMAMPAHLEPIAEQLFDEVCCGSRSMWPVDTKRFKEDEAYRAEFYRLAHQGWWNAQERFLARLNSDEPLVPGEEALYRMGMDTIAWTMIQKQLCYARRLFKENRQPNLKHSNLDSVVRVANQLRQQDPSCIPLITDLTSFVQVGDMLIFDSLARRMTIAEVKEGRKNAELQRKVMFYKQSGCEQFKERALQDESPQTAKQFDRMARQLDRMQFVTEALSDKKTRDPDTSKEVFIREAFVPIDEWDEEFNTVCDQAMEKGWAINMVDNCLFLGAYSKQYFPMSSTMFWLWLREFSGGEQTPVARMIDCVVEPLALPLPCLLMTPERIMDLLFGRLHVCMGISIPALIAECERTGITVRPPKNKHERKITNGWGQDAIRFQGQPIVLERDGKVVFPAAGIFVRCLFHFQRPMAFINAMFEGRDLLEDESESAETM